MREFWRLAQTTTVKGFISFLIEIRKMKIYSFDFPDRTENRYVWGKASDFEIIQTLRPESYFSHFTALYFYNLTLQVPKTIYLNFEQTKKNLKYPELTQQKIDFAFRQPWRTSKTISQLGDKRICIVNGKYTGQKGITEITDESIGFIRVTNLERTLIDITVRPIYAGGVKTVLEAYRKAANFVSINKLAALLSSMEYNYPYHQAIGFYLEKSAAYSDKQISLIDKTEKKFDFYLTRQIKEKEYSNRWKIYYPKGL
jgi:hypothetical protein